MAASGWLLVKLVSADKRSPVLAAAIAAIVAEFLLSRYLAPGVAWLPGVRFGRTLGLSYVMFRTLHVIVDAHGDELPGTIGLRDYLAYLFFFPSFLAGPIQRFEDFATALAGAPAAPAGALPGAAAHPIVIGYFKLTIVAGAFLAGFEHVAGAAAAPGRAAAFVAFAGYLYASFSGYTDVARGVARLFGFVLPENFDRPLGSANFLDLWSRWHISLSDWFKLYLFNPLTKALIARAGRPALVPYLGAVGFFATFFTMGLWHGTSARFALYGLCLGAGVSLNRLYQTLMTQRLGRRGYAALTRRAPYALLSRGLAGSYFVLALGFFWMPAAPPADTTTALCAALVGLAMVALVSGADLAAGFMRRLPPPGPLRFILYGTALAATMLYLWVQHGVAPPMIYQFF
jgi:D-alanyl-lipoteichoic acid acyltransferase DltB (MBOAT superfamily)